MKNAVITGFINGERKRPLSLGKTKADFYPGCRKRGTLCGTGRRVSAGLGCRRVPPRDPVKVPSPAIPAGCPGPSPHGLAPSPSGREGHPAPGSREECCLAISVALETLVGSPLSPH